MTDKHGDDDASPDLVRRSLAQNTELRSILNRAWPLLEATDLVGDLWSVPAYLRRCAPWLNADEIETLQRQDAHAWTVSDLPLLDAARQRLGDPEASRRKRRQAATVAAQREQMSTIVDDLIASDDSEMLVMSMLRGEDLQGVLVDDAALPSSDVDPLAGPFAHIVVDEAQELTDAEWQMLLLRCPSRSLTIVGDRAQARHGFKQSWQERLERIGLDHSQPGFPEHQLPNPDGGHVGGRTDHPRRTSGRQRADLGPQYRCPCRARVGVGPQLDPRLLAGRARRRDRMCRRCERDRRRLGPRRHPGFDSLHLSCARDLSSTSSSSSIQRPSVMGSKEPSTVTSQ